MSRVLFLCVHHAGRSHSLALFEKAVAGLHEAKSARTEPADPVHPVVVTAMQEEEIDLSRRQPRRLTEDLADWADVVITMGCGDACPVIPGKHYIDWDLRDPKDQKLEEVRAIPDEIKFRVAGLVKDLDRAAIGR